MPNSRSNAAPRLTEAQFQRQVTELAELRGWQWAHFRPAITSKGWRTPVSGPLGKGWPDLSLVRVAGDDRRLIFAELKAKGSRTTTEQAAVLDTLMALDWRWWHTDGIGWVLPRIEVHVWRPADWEEIEVRLR